MITFAAYGDSLTVRSGLACWANFANDGTELCDVGGYCLGGARSYVVATGVTVPLVADVTVVMVGTNDVSNPMWAVPLATTLAAIRDIIVRSGASKAVVAAIPPRNDGFHAEALAFNINVRNWVVDMGWRWVDPWVQLRTSEGRFRAGLTVDGIHPTVGAAGMVGHAMHYFIRAAATA